MEFEEGLRDNAALLGTIGAAAALKNQSAQTEAIKKQSKLLEEQAEIERKKLNAEQQRLEIEKERLQAENEHRERQDELERIRKRAIKEVRTGLANAKNAIDRLEEKFQKY